MRVTLLYHMGSVAIGSFIMAIVQFIRIVLEYMDRESKGLQKREVAMPWLKYVMYALQLLLKALECIVKFINRSGPGHMMRGTCCKLIMHLSS